MKKRYEKPWIICESFELSQSIAACGISLNLGTVEVCESKPNSGGLFTEGNGFVKSNGECTYIISDYCYTNGSEFTATHTS